MTTTLLLVAIGCGKKEVVGTGGPEAPAPGPSKAGTSGPGIEGTYLLTGISYYGKKVPDEEVAKEPEAERTVYITGGKFIGKMGTPEYVEEELKTDATTTPAQITLTMSGRDGKPNTRLGIYKIEGDVLTIATADDSQQPPKKRPGDFSSNTESLVLTLKRVGPPTNPPPAPARRPNSPTKQPAPTGKP